MNEERKKKLEELLDYIKKCNSKVYITKSNKGFMIYDTDNIDFNKFKKLCDNSGTDCSQYSSGIFFAPRHEKAKNNFKGAKVKFKQFLFYKNVKQLDKYFKWNEFIESDLETFILGNIFKSIIKNSDFNQQDFDKKLLDFLMNEDKRNSIFEEEAYTLFPKCDTIQYNKELSCEAFYYKTNNTKQNLHISLNNYFIENVKGFSKKQIISIINSLKNSINSISDMSALESDFVKEHGQNLLSIISSSGNNPYYIYINKNLFINENSIPFKDKNTAIKDLDEDRLDWIIKESKMSAGWKRVAKLLKYGIEDKDFFLERGLICNNPKIIPNLKKDLTKFSIYDWFKLYEIQTNDENKPTKFFFPVKLAGYINRMREIIGSLECLDCSNYIIPNWEYAKNYKINSYNIKELPEIKVGAAYRVTIFKCINESCKQVNKNIYLNHCIGWNCHSIIDSRKIKNKCKFGRYKCESCSSCCEKHIYKNYA